MSGAASYTFIDVFSSSVLGPDFPTVLQTKNNYADEDQDSGLLCCGPNCKLFNSTLTGGLSTRLICRDVGRFPTKKNKLMIR
jgi:hypothetical protein